MNLHSSIEVSPFLDLVDRYLIVIGRRYVNTDLTAFLEVFPKKGRRAIAMLEASVIKQFHFVHATYPI